ncbi:CBS domain-containing protein [Acidihalobacter yilgarnensis]|nr:CBS domain-containing protein [Acidihalobacter yilgarnensis]
MTDLQHVRAVTTITGASLSNAHQRMIHTGVRLLFVLDREGCVAGLISARDLMGEQPMLAAVREHLSYDQLHVEHIMTPASAIQVLDFTEVLRAQVSDVIQTLREHDRQHALVVEYHTDGEQRIRGIFSLSQISRLLGIPLSPSGIAQNVAELDHILNH